MCAGAAEYSLNLIAASARPVTHRSFLENYDGKETQTFILIRICTYSGWLKRLWLFFLFQVGLHH